MVAALVGCAGTPPTAGAAAEPDEHEPTCAGLYFLVDDGWVDEVCITCASSGCAYAMRANDDVSALELDVREDGGERWSEWHDAFLPGGNGATEGWWFLSLAVVADASQYASNLTTLFDLSDTAVMGGSAVLFSLVDEWGDYVECVSVNDPKALFGEDCRALAWPA